MDGALYLRAVVGLIPDRLEPNSAMGTENCHTMFFFYEIKERFDHNHTIIAEEGRLLIPYLIATQYPYVPIFQNQKV
jgi:hypothetical protein